MRWMRLGKPYPFAANYLTANYLTFGKAMAWCMAWVVTGISNLLMDSTVKHTLPSLSCHASYHSPLLICLLIGLLGWGMTQTALANEVNPAIETSIKSSIKRSQSSDPKTYSRIVTLAPHLTELVYSAGAGDLLVGVSQFSDFPATAQTLPVIGGANAIALEKILSLQPDLILGWRSANRAQDTEQLERLQSQFGYRFLESEIETLEDIPRLIAQIGELTGRSNVAQKKSLELTHVLHQLSLRYSQRNAAKPPQVLYQVWDDPLMTVGRTQFMSQAIELCGAKNLFADIEAMSAQVSLETIIDRNPQVIVLGGTQGQQQAWIAQWQSYSLIDAVKNQHLVALDESVYQRPTERFIQALPKLCQLIHGIRAEQ